MSQRPNAKEVNLAVDYAENPVIRAIVNLVPGGLGSATDVLIVHRAEAIKKERIRTFFEELGAGQIELTEELIKQDDFIHSLDATMRAAFRSRRAEKVKMFARLLGRGAVRGETKSFDDYEELVSLLDELSYREWQAFLIFSTHLDSRPADPNPLARVQPIWAAVVADFESQLGIAQAEASSFLVRIGRTGLLARSQAVTGTIKAVWA